MTDGAFLYENDLLKHHVRTSAWLPLCKNRLKTIRENDPSRIKRRLKYFTFCAVGAIDVLMLDVASVIRQSSNGRFDTVVFFDRTQENVVETQRRIPGAIGFPGDFVKVVLLNDPEEEMVVDADHLSAFTGNPDEFFTRQLQILYEQRRSFIHLFPFDVINLDLEEFLFKPTDPLPGRVINVLRKILEWQHRPFTTQQNGAQQHLDGFSLMFTTRIGPPNISDEYLSMLREYLDSNLQENQDLIPLFTERTGGISTVENLQRNAFELFFKLAVPKILATVLIETGWYADPETGIQIFEFERTPEGVEPYRMLHLVLDVLRENPPRQNRPPRINLSAEARDAYLTVVRRIFTESESIVTIENIDQNALQESLDLILARRRLYCPEN